MLRPSVVNVCVALVLCPLTAYAEVADKMPSQPRLWAEGLVLGVLVFVLGRWRPWLALIPGALGALLVLNAWGDFHEPAMAEAIRAELGSGYEAVSYTASAIPLVAVAVYFIWRQVRRKGGSDGA